MIGYSLISGDEIIGKSFKPYIWKNIGFGDFIEGKLNNYINDNLRLILIMYYVDGKFSVNGPEGYKVNNYSPKDRSISVAHTIPANFWQFSEQERKQYIADSTLRAFELVKKRLEKKKNGIDFESLEHKLKDLANEWLKSI